MRSAARNVKEGAFFGTNGDDKTGVRPRSLSRVRGNRVRGKPKPGSEPSKQNQEKPGSDPSVLTRKLGEPERRKPG